MQARILFWQKSKLHGRYVVELKIYELVDSVKYPDGVKYGLICIDSETSRRILMDNHHPKGPHIHFDHNEIPYKFRDVHELMHDFKSIVLEYLEVKL